jgi:hypothetical protein
MEPQMNADNVRGEKKKGLKTELSSSFYLC